MLKFYHLAHFYWEVVKIKRYFHGQADCKGCPPPAPLGTSRSVFFYLCFGVRLSFVNLFILSYDYIGQIP